MAEVLKSWFRDRNDSRSIGINGNSAVQRIANRREGDQHDIPRAACNALAKGTRARSASRNGKGHTHAYRITGNLFILRESVASEYRIDIETTYFSLNHNLNTETYRRISLSILYKISISFNLSNVSFP